MTRETFTKHKQQFFDTVMNGRQKSSKVRCSTTLERLERFIYRNGEQEVDIESMDFITQLSQFITERMVRNGQAVFKTRTRQFFRWMQRAGYIQNDRTNLINTPRIKQAPPRPLVSLEEYQQLKDATVGTPLWWIIVCAWATGMSTVDVCTLKVSEVDLEKMCIVRRRRKSYVESIIPIEAGSEFHRALLFKLERMDKDHHGHEEGVLYVDPAIKSEYDRNGSLSFAESFRKATKRAGIKNKRMTLASFRVTFCSMLANSGINLGVACKMSGHSNPNTFVGRYLIPDARALHDQLVKARQAQSDINMRR